MTEIPEKPLMVLARLDTDSTLRWWIRNPDSTYDAWPTTSCIVDVEPHRLIPSRLDYQQFGGDNAAIVEIRNARDKHLARSR